MGRLIVLLFIFGFFIVPIVIGLIQILLLFTIKKELKKAGKNYFKMMTKKNSKFEYIYLIFMIILFCFFIIIGQRLLIMICLGTLLWNIGDIIKNKLFGNISGIYENGIIIDKHLIKWNEIHFVKINENNISVFLNDGEAFDYMNILNINEIKELFNKNGIMERE